MHNTSALVEAFFGIIGAVIILWTFLKGGVGNQTIKLMESNKKAQDDAIKRLEDDAKAKDEKINNLSGQVQVLKDIPLGQIAKSLEIVSETHKNFQEFMAQQVERSQQLADGIASSVADKVIQSIKDNQNGQPS